MTRPTPATQSKLPRGNTVYHFNEICCYMFRLESQSITREVCCYESRTNRYKECALFQRKAVIHNCPAKCISRSGARQQPDCLKIPLRRLSPRKAAAGAFFNRNKCLPLFFFSTILIAKILRKIKLLLYALKGSWDRVLFRN